MFGNSTHLMGSKNNGCTDSDIQYNHYDSEDLADSLSDPLIPLFRIFAQY